MQRAHLALEEDR